jgi:hypothetical protein
MSARQPSAREGILERENRDLRERLNRLQSNPPEMPTFACDNSCLCARAEGMAPNGGCRWALTFKRVEAAAAAAE